MNNGLTVDLKELIALKKYACAVNYPPDGRALRVGNHQSKLRGRGMDFAEVRNYQAGDEVRHMEWRVTARTGRPHVKIFQEEKERPAMLLNDFSASMFFGTRKAFKSVIASQLSAIIAWTAVKQGDRLGGMMFSEQHHHEFQPKGREAGVLPILSSLCQYTNVLPDTIKTIRAEPFNEALCRLKRVAKPGSMIVLISDFYKINQETEKHLSFLRTHHDILAYHICDPLELAPPAPDQYAVTNGEQELLLDIAENSTQSAYRDFCINRIEQLKTIMKRNQIQYVQVTPDTDLGLLVKSTYPRRHQNA